jgi:hypothetical protein
VTGDALRVATERECRSFTRFLLRTDPSDYVIGKYLEAHRVCPDYAGGDEFGRWLVRTASRGPRMAALADGFAALCDRRGLLRKKLVLLLAILETSTPAYRMLEPVDRAAFATVLALAWRGLGSVIVTALGIAVFLPVRLARSRRRG